MIRTNYSRGYVVLNQDRICFNSWLLLPAEDLWPSSVRGVLYTIAIFYLFLGIAIAADVFMLSIEMITSKKRLVLTYDYEKGESVETQVYVWNETVANLTLMALGSSAPEILIAVIETVTNLDNNGSQGLGTFTIIGSAAYNLLVISAVCVLSVPSKTLKRVGEFGVFIVTSMWSMFAYFWLLVVLKWSSPNVIEVWEACLTLAFFPLLVITAWCQDKGWWRHKFCKKKPATRAEVKRNNNQEHKASQPYSGSHIIGVQPASGGGSFNFDTEVMSTSTGHRMSHRDLSGIRMRKISESKSKIRNIVTYVKDHEAMKNTTAKDIVEGIKNYMEPTENKSLARARFRHVAIRSLINGKHVPTEGKSNIVGQALKEDEKKHDTGTEKTNVDHDSVFGSFAFSSASYSVVQRSRELKVSVLFHLKRRKKIVGFSHIVEAAKKASASGAMQPFPLPKPHIVDRGESSADSVNSQKTCISTIDEFDDSFQEWPNHRSLTKSDSGFHGLMRAVGEKPPAHTVFVVNDSSRKNSNCDRDAELSDIQKRGARLSLIELGSTADIWFETRDGTAKQGKDYTHTEGNLAFMEHEYCNTIRIPIEDTNENDSSEEKYFFVILKKPSNSTSLGDPSVAKVTIINDNEPGELMFQEATYHVDYATGFVTANVIRIHGCDGTVFVSYRTINGTAFGGEISDLENGLCDFEEIKEEKLEFGNGETSKRIKIKVNMNSKRGKSFIVLLYNQTTSAKLGHRSAAIITLTSDVDEIVDQVANIMTEEAEEKSLSQMWNEQFYEAMSIGDEKTITPLSYVLHFLSFFWKVLVAFIPPRNVFGGWASFVLSLLLLGILSALIEQLAKLLGCILGLKITVTGITIVALGTSMPDTFASRSAATQDDTADASIGNITGSNSVNVFLGLGLPWVIKTIYKLNKGEKVEIIDENIHFSILTFLCCGLVALAFLILRRKVYGGELGGPRASKYASGLALITLWFAFITLCSLRAYGHLPQV